MSDSGYGHEDITCVTYNIHVDIFNWMCMSWFDHCMSTYDRTLPRPYLNSCLENPAGHFNGLLETNSSDQRNPRSEPSLSITGLLV